MDQERNQLGIAAHRNFISFLIKKFSDRPLPPTPDTCQHAFPFFNFFCVRVLRIDPWRPNVHSSSSDQSTVAHWQRPLMNGQTNRWTACCEGYSTNAVGFKFTRSGEGNLRAAPCIWLPAAAMFEKDLKNAFIISRLGWHEKSLLYELLFNQI